MSKTQLARSCGVLLVYGHPVQSFLLMRHSDRWDFPKGHVDPGETDLECALREMEEETGISRSHVRVDPDFLYEQQYQVTSTRYGGSESEMVTKTLVLYLAYVDEEYAISVTEHDDSRWFPWSPPHSIQARAIDPLLIALEDYLIRKEENAPRTH
ncbi:MAG TPA: NUDIX domain-containing protein [Planctomicrobium sp.]|nr:NUDIX domain-containing protein [Planctomicrobium sp.]